MCFFDVFVEEGERDVLLLCHLALPPIFKIRFNCRNIVLCENINTVSGEGTWAKKRNLSIFHSDGKITPVDRDGRELRTH